MLCPLRLTFNLLKTSNTSPHRKNTERCCLWVLEFSPDHFVDNADIGLDDHHNLGRDIFFDVIGDWDAVVTVLVHRHSSIYRRHVNLYFDYIVTAILLFFLFSSFKAKQKTIEISVFQSVTNFLVIPLVKQSLFSATFQKKKLIKTIASVFPSPFISQFSIRSHLPHFILKFCERNIRQPNTHRVS